MTVFVSGPLTNPMNGSRGHWSKHARWARGWRERTAMVLLAEMGMRRRYDGIQKRVTLLAQTARIWDDDNLRVAMKPIRDALKDAGLIDDDAPQCGHVFHYEQRVDRANRGVRITVTAR